MAAAKLKPVIELAEVLSPDVISALEFNRVNLDDLNGKLIVIGDMGVGKTALLERFSKDQFMTVYKSTIGVDYVSRTYTIQNHDFKLSIWDTAGDERFRSISLNYYHGADAALICYDVSSVQSLRNVPTWHEQVMQHSGPKTVVMLAGCKSDLQPKVKEEDAEAVARQLGVEHVRVSAKVGTRVRNLFDMIALKLFDREVKEEMRARERKRRGEDESFKIARINLNKPSAAGAASSSGAAPSEKKCSC